MADVTIKGEGKVILFNPLSPTAKEWVSDNLNLEPWQWFGESFAVEGQYCDGIINGMKEDGLEVESKSKTAAIPVSPQITPNVPSSTAQAPGATQQPGQAAQPQRLGESVEVAEPQQKERHTVPPELPNALFHMASVLARKKAAGDVIQTPSFSVANEVAIEDFKKHKNKVVTAIEILASPDSWDGESEPSNTEVFHLDEPLHVRVLNTPVRNLMNWVRGEYLMPYWQVIPVGKIPVELKGYKSFWIYGHIYSVLSDQSPMTYEEARKHIEAVPEDFSEADKLRLHGLGVQAKLAGRGGWHRVSKSTVQSDDKRFTITEVDPTRRKNWFMLKDLETGISYTLPTMTAAKKKSKSLLEGTPEEAVTAPPPVLAKFKDPFVEDRLDPEDVLQPSDVEKRGRKMYRKNTPADIQYNRS